MKKGDYEAEITNLQVRVKRLERMVGLMKPLKKVTRKKVVKKPKKQILN